MIIVTGATGQYGRQVVSGLLQKLPASQIGVSVQNPAKASDLAQAGIHVRAGNFADPGTLLAAFDGAQQLLIVSVNRLGDEAVRLHGNAITAARQAGVKRILYTSHQAASPSSLFVPGRSHAATEALLQASGVPFVSLRNGFYAESALYQLDGLKQTGQIALPHDGPVSWTARADLAGAAVAALTEPDLFDGITPPLTASETLDFAGVAQIASAVLGRPVTREVVNDEAFVSRLVVRGFAEPMARSLLTLYLAARAGEFNVADPTLERILGHKPITLRHFLEEFLQKSQP